MLFKRKIRKTLALLLALSMAATIALPQSFAGTDYWAIFKKAETEMKAKHYQVALDQYKKALPEFVKKNDQVNMALIYGRMAKCEAELALYDQAAKNWNQEAAIWAKLGKNEDKQIALRKANAVTSELKLFISREVTPENAKSFKLSHDALFEPAVGIYLGAYAENDKAVHDPYSAEKRFQTQFPVLTEKKHASYLLYFTYGKEIKSYQSHFEKAKATGTAIQLALQPMNGLSEVKNDAYLSSLIKAIDSYGVPVFLRFANEMNESSAPWFGPAKDYIPVFQMVSKEVKANSKNIAMVWAPAWFPPDTVDAYYPGDAYVDWVGVSMYKAYNPELDPLNRGVDRESYLKKLEQIYNKYSGKKPIFISEGGVSYTDIKTGKLYDTWAADQIKKFYAYLPMLYPKVKAMYWFDTTRVVDNIPRSYRLSENQKILKAYQEAIKPPYYLTDLGQSASIAYEPVLTGGNLQGTEVELNAYVKTIEPDIARVEYWIGGKRVGESKVVPYSLKVDLSQYKNSKQTITVKAFDAKGKVMTEKGIALTIQ